MYEDSNFAVGELQTATILLALAAIGGILMAAMRFGGKPRPPTFIALGHGLLTLTAIGFLIYGWATAGIPGQAQLATVILLAAASGGAFIHARYHAAGLALPIPLVTGHIVIAVTGFLLLAFAVIRLSQNAPALPG